MFLCYLQESNFSFLNSFLVLVGITKLSIQFANTPLCNSFLKMLFIILWNIPSELQSPKYITLGLNRPLLVKKTAFHLFPSLIHTLLYFQIRSSLLKYFAFFSLLIIFPIRGSGILSLIIYWFNFQQSCTNHSDLSFFGMQKHDTIYLELDFIISSVFSCSFSYWFNTSFFFIVIMQALALSSFGASSMRLIS